MKPFLLTVAITLLLLPIAYPLRAQDGGFGGGDSVDIMLGDRGGGRGGFNGNNNGGRGGVVMPDSKTMMSDIQNALKKGKTPLDKAQEKPLKGLLDLEIVSLTDHLQVLRLSNENNNNNQNGFPGGGDFNRGGPPPEGFNRGGDFNRGGPPPEGFNRGGNPQAGTNATANAETTAFTTAIAVQTETVTSLRNDDFLDTKLVTFLSPEQVAVIQKVRKEDKENATCLGGLLDRVSAGTQNNTGGRGGNRGNFNLNNNSSKKTNGQPFCMAADATPSARLEPIRKELAKANLPLSKDKETIAEVFMKSQIKDLEDALRTTLTANFSNNRGGNSINRSTNIQVVTQNGIDDIYKKAGATLNPPQTESLKKWHFEQILARGGIESLISLEAVQNTPLTDNQIARVTAAWTDLHNQLQSAAKAANKNPQPKDLDNAVMPKVVAMLEPAQIASYEAARKAVPVK